MRDEKEWARGGGGWWEEGVGGVMPDFRITRYTRRQNIQAGKCIKCPASCGR